MKSIPNIKKWIYQANLDIVVLNGNLLLKAIKLFRLLKAKKVMFLFTYLLTSNVLGAVIGRLANVKYRIGGIRNAYLHPKKEIIERFIHNQFNNKTIFNNHSGILHYSNRGFKTDKITIIPNCIQLHPSIDKNLSKGITILSVGRFVKQKDYFTVIEAIKLLIEAGYINIRYEIIGFGAMQTEIENKIITNKLENYISLIINPPDLDSYYKNASIYLCTSIFEGLSNSVLEAMSYSLPIVATDVGDNKYIVKNQHNGYLIKPSIPEEVVKSLKSILDKKGLIKNMGSKSYQIVKNDYSINAYNERYLKLIRDLQVVDVNWIQTY